MRPKRRIILTESELQVRREKELCFHYNDKFELGRCCKTFLQIMIVHEDDVIQQE